MPRVLPYLLALTLGAATSVLVACGADRSNLIPPDHAQALVSRLNDVQAAVDGGDCSTADTALDEVRAAFRALPATVDARLRARIHQGYVALRRRAPQDCATATTATTQPETQTETLPTVTTPTETVTTTTTPTETTTVPTTPTGTVPTTTTPAETGTSPVTPTGTTPAGTGGEEAVPTS